MFDQEQFRFLLPIFILSIGILGTMLASSIRVETRFPAKLVSAISLLLTIISCVSLIGTPSQNILGGILEVSNLSLFSIFFISAIGLLFVMGSTEYLNRENLHFSDFYTLILLMTLGAAVLVSTKDLFVLFIALELMSLPAYSLVGFRRNDSRSNEASLKYFILGGSLGAVFLLGTSFVFGSTGTTVFNGVYEWTKIMTGDPSLFFVGHLLVLFAFLFKVASVPFHFWKPDVYEGAPVNVTGLMATVVTSSAFIVLVRLFNMVDFQVEAFAPYLIALKKLIRISAVLSLLFGSTILILQKNLKRLMAYSAITHTGYILLGLLGTLSKPEEVYSVWLYLIGYSIISCGIFLVFCQSETKNDQGLELVDLTGLLKRNPFQTAILSVFFLSMAGMPLTVGFFVKYAVFMSSISAGEIFFVVFAAICTVIGAYGYLRPIGLMVMREPDPTASRFVSSKSNQITVLTLALLCLFLGFFPQYLIQLTKGLELIH